MEKRFVSAILSGFVFPGAGQFYNNQPAKGVIYVLLTVLSIIVLVFVIARDLYRALENVGVAGGGLWDPFWAELGGSRGSITILLIILAISWAVGIVDAYMVAQDREDRKRAGTISRRGR
ncbi:MAG: hypothetical protein JW765_02675 [Deltaproteobacteria bacterium]|nr:hypothetical protein [Candidatus Zymogenaceae bacterium]